VIITGITKEKLGGYAAPSAGKFLKIRLFKEAKIALIKMTALTATTSL
jgi:hypothetical protein